MEREEAIRILDPVTTGEALAEIEYYNGFTGKTAAVQAVSDACVLAVAALREQGERRWIPVTERLPDIGIVVLVYSEDDGICLDYYVGDSFDYYDVTHWMPLPEPPEKAINQDHNQGKENDYGNQSE